MIEIDNIYNMDCIEGMKLMADGSVDAVIADMPYGVLNRSNRAAHWDRQIPLEALWEQLGFTQVSGDEEQKQYERKLTSLPETEQIHTVVWDV